jgi:hypothetical protein
VRRGADVRSADIPLSDRERAEGFHPTVTSTVTLITTAVTTH